MKSLALQYQLIVLTTLLLGVSSLRGLTMPGSDGAASILEGGLAEVIEDHYDNALPIKPIASGLLTAFSLAVFGEASPGVVVGDQYWLYSDEEFIADLDANATYEKNLSFIVATRDRLASIGTELLVVPVPSKARVYPEFTRYSPAEMHQNLYERFLVDLDSQDINVVNTLPGLLQGKQSREMFLITDTHWTPEGAANVAVSVQSVLEYKGLGGENSHKTTRLNQLVLQGDLTAFVEVSPWFDHMTGGPELIDQYATDAVDAGDLFAVAESADVVLVGTSYSANPHWHFDGFLASAARSSIANFSAEGQGPFAPMATFMEQQMNEQLAEADSIRLVIWEIPERYLINRQYLAQGVL